MKLPSDFISDCHVTAVRAQDTHKERPINKALRLQPIVCRCMCIKLFSIEIRFSGCCILPNLVIWNMLQFMQTRTSRVT